MATDSAAADYPIPEKLNLLIIAGQLVATFAIFYGASQATTWVQIGLLALAFAIVGNSIYSIIHEAEHRMLHPKPRINDALGAFMALLFPHRTISSATAICATIDSTAPITKRSICILRAICRS